MKNLLRDVKISTRVFVLVGMTALLMGLVIGLALRQVSAIGEEVTTITMEDIPLLKVLNRITLHSTEQNFHFERTIQLSKRMTQDETSKDNFETERNNLLRHCQKITQEIEDGRKLVEQMCQKYEADKAKDMLLSIDYALRSIDKERADFQFLAERALNLLSQGKLEQAESATQKIAREYKTEEEGEEIKQEELLVNLSSGIENFVGYTVAEARRTIQNTIVGMVSYSALILLLSLVLGVFVSRTVTKPLSIAVNVANQIAAGDRNVEIKAISKDETGQLLAAMEKMSCSISRKEEELIQTNNTLKTEIAEREHAEEQLKHAQAELQKQVTEMVEARQAALNMMEDINQEITERKKAEEKLQQAADEWTTTFNSFTELVSIQDKDYKLIRVNKAFADAFGMKPEEIVGKTCFKLVHGTKEPWSACAHKKTLETKKPHTEEFFEPHLGVYLEVSTSPIFDENGEVLATTHVAKNITERKQKEEKIKELAKFVSENPNPIVKISKDCTILYANDAGAPLLETWGCEEGQRLPQPHAKLVEKVLSSGEAITCELESTSNQVFSVTLAPVVKAGYVNVYGLDITELRLSKEYLKQVRKQAEIKSQFVSTVSHELRTPLTTMKEGVSIVLDGIAGEINDKQRHFLDIIRRNLDRLARFINDVLDFQKLEAGKMEVDMRSNNMNEVVEEIIETMSCPANEKGLDLIAKLDETMPVVDFDRDRIIQVLINLVGNAIKFTDTGNITIATAKADDTVRISVHDTGPGIKKENLPRLFHEFEQLSDTNERKTGGSGLGLVISRRIIEKHNGKIWVESESGKGTSFYFELPVQEKKALAMAEKS